MPKLQPNYLDISVTEEQAINAVAQSDSDNPPLTEQQWADILPRLRVGDSKFLKSDINPKPPTTAIIEVGANPDSDLTIAKVFEPDTKQWLYVLRFTDIADFYKNLTSKRIQVFGILNKIGACSVYGLAEAARRNYANVYRDVKILEQLGLIKRNKKNQIIATFNELEIRFNFATKANNDQYFQQTATG